MKSVSEQYKEAMKLQIRNRSSLMVAIGNVDLMAQTSAKDGNRTGGEYYSTVKGVFNENIAEEYSTLEQDFTRADGSMMFVPRETQEELIQDVGYVGEGVNSGSTENARISCVFAPTSVPFKITFDLGEHFLPKIALYATLDTGEQVMVLVTYNNTHRKITGTLNSLPTGAKSVVGVEMYGWGGDHRFRVKQIVIGDGLLINPDIIESTEQKNYCSKINENLPTSDLTINLINYDSRYDADNPKNPLAILDEGEQEVNIYYGYDVDGQGNYEWIHGCKAMSSDWESSKFKATIHAHDILQDDERLYIHNNAQLWRFPTALFWVEDVLQAMGISDYEVDADMDDIIMTLPIIKTYPMKEMLQLIANYCCKTLFISGDGKVVISDKVNTTYEETVLDSDTVVVDTISVEDTYTGTTSTEYEKVEARVMFSDANSNITYFDEVEYDGTDYTYNFFSRYGDGTYVISILGYISSETPNFEITSDDIIEDIDIEKEEVIKEVIVPYYSITTVPIETTVLSEETVSVGSSGMDYTVSFGDTIYGDIELEIQSINNLVDAEDFEQGSISGTSGQNIASTTRLRSDYIEVSANTTYKIETQSDLYIFEIYEYESDNTFITYTTVNKSEDYFETGDDTAYVRILLRRPENEDVTPSDIETIRMVQTTVSAGFAPTDYLYTYLPNEGEYRVIVRASGTVQYVFNTVSYSVNPNGKSLTWDNPLIGSAEVAESVAEFVGEYLKSNLSYSYEYRGNPELDTNDVILQENDFSPNMQVVVTEHTIKFNGGLDGEIKARRKAE